MTRAGLVAATVALLAAGAARAQEPRVDVIGDARVGRDAPDFSWGYLTADGPGPADQPFHLRAELGRTVVLVFTGAPAAPGVKNLWEYLAASGSAVFRPGTVVVGVLRAGSEPVQALAAELGSPFKFLPDSLGRTGRRFGLSGQAQRAGVFVVNDLGRVTYRSLDFRAERPADVERLKRALLASAAGG